MKHLKLDSQFITRRYEALLIKFPRLNDALDFLYHWGYVLVIALLLAIILFTHLYQLAQIPMGLYLDETSIGYNAALIAQSGKDEYGFAWPIYFKAFDDSKSPIYIYANALLFYVFGISELNLRLTSFLFFASGLICAFIFVGKVFPKNRLVQIYLLITFGFLPHFFTFSRIAFDGQGAPKHLSALAHPYQS